MEFKLISIASIIAFYGCYFVKMFHQKSREYIDIFVFWIWNIQNHMIDYETTCDVSTWWCR